MALWTPDPTFCPSPRDAAAAPAERLAYVAAFDRRAQRPDSGGLGVAALHTPAMFAVAGAVALVVFEVVGLTVLRRAWFDVDRMWAVALVGAGVLTLAQA
ncbi:hypothetical protein [Nonomuraea sp. bgisy101]|uniref:hypothetical protein n=1 Tax=Nonomuraea sp. bgisy101 TaxID=3413784 RepID=UPI003D73EFE4